LIIPSQKNNFYFKVAVVIAIVVAPLVFDAAVAVDIVGVVTSFAYGSVSVVIVVEYYFTKTTFASKFLLSLPLLLLLLFLMLLL
jgi:hypothetical protein